jgi:hypothetical protein
MMDLENWGNGGMGNWGNGRRVEGRWVGGSVGRWAVGQ